MMNRKGFKYVPGFLLAGSVAAVALTNGGCSAVTTLEGAAQGCDEFPGSVGTLQLGGDAQAFVQAGADVVALANKMEGGVLTACEGIDADLMVTDTWTAMGPMAMGGSTDNEMTEACHQASVAISGILQGSAGAQADCSLSVSAGQCQVSASAEATCEGQCSASGSCTPPDVTVACQAGDLSGQCSAMCEANATCEGSATVEAQCQGSCEADCTGNCVPGTLPKVHCEGTCMGNCTGTCTAMGGTGMMVQSATCTGTCSGDCDAECDYTPGTPAHCEGTCQGTCNGNCKITATGGVSCSGMATCRGGCSVMVTAPQCEGQIKPAMCNASADCQASCSSHASLTATCTPPSAHLECSASASANVQTLVTTLSKNLPPIISAVQTQGPLAAQATANLATTGAAVVGDIGSASGKALACAEAAVSAAASASVSINVTVMASASVSGSCGGPMM
jgi:hypothetical protein